MPRLTDLLPNLPAILGSTAILTYGMIVLIQARTVPDGADPVRTPPSARDAWRLRASDVATTSSIGQSELKGRQATEIPDERRVVRVVYPGLAGPH
ncbi:hypothetical protein [Methylobacterium goesingense]|uniref:Uncharacterized protein n=1 Tax=Methylobacterium goesingense TaxID=243690 RepID=A0ABV2LCH0_9HYPH|nr:hypothetical protein [Methylobacterium goesingense]GJD76454.1 hypothetical protein CFIICLFH_4712 [Methylobacterium goesingense]